jgi:hypothetical protein
MIRTTLVDLPSSLSAERHDHIAVLRLSRPEKRNAIDLTMVHGIDRFFSELPSNIRAERDLAERVGVSQPAIYRHFTDLDDLLSTLCRNGFDAFDETERQVMAKSSDPWARLRGLIRAYIHFATNNPAYFRIMFDSGFANRPENIGRARLTKPANRFAMRWR